MLQQIIQVVGHEKLPLGGVVEMMTSGLVIFAVEAHILVATALESEYSVVLPKKSRPFARCHSFQSALSFLLHQISKARLDTAGSDQADLMCWSARDHDILIGLSQILEWEPVFQCIEFRLIADFALELGCRNTLRSLHLDQVDCFSDKTVVYGGLMAVGLGYRAGQGSVLVHRPNLTKDINSESARYFTIKYCEMSQPVLSAKQIKTLARKKNLRNLSTKNPWHFVSPGENAPQVVRALIEIPTGCKAKYELDKESGLIKLDRILFSAVHYPANYGFIPMTYGDDHDPLDILVLCSVQLEIMCLVDAKVIGVMRMKDQGELDDKIIAVALNDMSVNHYNDLNDLPQHVLQQIHRFFEDYKKLEKKEVQVEQFAGREKAYEIINEAIKFYQGTFMTEADIAEETLRTTKAKEQKEKQNAKTSLHAISESDEHH